MREQIVEMISSPIKSSNWNILGFPDPFANYWIKQKLKGKIKTFGPVMCAVCFLNPFEKNDC